MVDDQINTPHDQFIPLVDIRVMQDCVNGLSNNKAPGLDGISSEHIKYGGTQLLVHLWLLVNAMIKHSFVPADFCFGMIILLLKDKYGDTSRLDM